MKHTPLHDWHIEAGANMSEFASYSMPLWYPQGVKKEHDGVIESCGLFDTSHMSSVLVEGVGARQLLQRALTKDLRCCFAGGRPLVEGRCVYGVFLNEKGNLIDDAIVYQRGDDCYLVVVNAAMGGVIAQHLADFDISAALTITDMTDRLGKIDIQGPAAARILKGLIADPERVFANMPYFSFKGWFASSSASDEVRCGGIPVLLSRTGYTGEFGFEIFVTPQHLEKIWYTILEEGGERIIPCGLAARDSLRTGAMLPLSHKDIGGWPFLRNPWQFALPSIENGTYSKSFVGAEALAKVTDCDYTYAFAGYDPRKITPGVAADVVDVQGNVLGHILSCTTDMAIDRVDGGIVSIATSREDGRPADFKARGLCCGFIKVSEEIDYGETVFLNEGNRKIRVEIRSDIRPDRTARCSMETMFTDARGGKG